MLGVWKCHFHAEEGKAEIHTNQCGYSCIPSSCTAGLQCHCPQVRLTPQNHSALKQPPNLLFLPKPSHLIKVPWQLCKGAQSRTLSLCFPDSFRSCVGFWKRIHQCRPACNEPPAPPEHHHGPGCHSPSQAGR